jgi:hypothetical protein
MRLPLHLWINGPNGPAMLPFSSGHLVFSHKSGSRVMDAKELTVEVLHTAMSSGSAVIENCAAGGLDERALFHAFNHAKQQQGHLLLTAEEGPAKWNIRLPDLSSRLIAAPQVQILLPDDELLRGVMVKHFHDRQIVVPEQVIGYLMQRIPRSLQSVRQIVQEIDTRALAAHAEITRPFVAQVLSEFTSPQLFEDEGDGFTQPS